jgi:type IV pilus assembly protein PilV
MKPRFLLRRKETQTGFTLLEVLVAILICSFGLLGIIGLQARAVQFSAGSEDTNRAVLLANDIASTMLTSNTINLPAAVVTLWQDRLDIANNPSSGLPNGSGTVTVAGTLATVTITWRPPNAASGAPNSQNQYVTQVMIPQ